MPRMTTLLTLLRLSKYAEYTYLQLHTTVLILCEHAFVHHSRAIKEFFILFYFFIYLFIYFLVGAGVGEGKGGGEVF